MTSPHIPSHIVHSCRAWEGEMPGILVLHIGKFSEIPAASKHKNTQRGKILLYSPGGASHHRTMRHLRKRRNLSQA